MNDSEQIDDLMNKSRWSAKRVVLMYWFALMFLGGGVALGLGFQLTNPSFEATSTYDHSQIAEPWHADQCEGCHSDQYDEWGKTDHNTTTYPENSTHVYNAYGFRTWASFNDSCAECRSTRFQNVSGVITYWDVGITCAACHDAGVTNHSAAMCGDCHRTTGDHHRPYEDYSISAHAESLTDILASDHAGDYCAHCMLGQGLYAGTGDYGFSAADLTLNNTIAEPISCATCHDPHEETYHYQLRNETVVELCGTCHGGGGRHNEYALFTDATYKSQNKHANVDCATCHGYQLLNATTGEYRLNHTWALDLPGSCSQNNTCHTDAAAKVTAMGTMQTDFETALAAYETLLTEVETLVDEANETSGVDQTEVDSAYDLIDDAGDLAGIAVYDSSEGFHNNAMVTAKLAAATTKLNEAKAIAEQAIEDAEESEDDDSPGFEFLGVLVGLGLLSVVALFIRKRKY